MFSMRVVVQFFLSKQPVTIRAMLLVASIGMCAGLLIGYVMMGSMHAVCEPRYHVSVNDCSRVTPSCLAVLRDGRGAALQLC
jgi:hypothetical protein